MKAWLNPPNWTAARTWRSTLPPMFTNALLPSLTPVLEWPKLISSTTWVPSPSPGQRPSWRLYRWRVCQFWHVYQHFSIEFSLMFSIHLSRLVQISPWSGSLVWASTLPTWWLKRSQSSLNTTMTSSTPGSHPLVALSQSRWTMVRYNLVFDIGVCDIYIV